MNKCLRCQTENIKNREVELGVTVFLFENNNKKYEMTECEDRRTTKTIYICEACYILWLEQDWVIDRYLDDIISSIKEVT